MTVDIDPQVSGMYVPSFMIQPLVENAVKHAMRAEGKLTISITGAVEGDNIVIRVRDDGTGMDDETIANMMNKESTTGLGIAVKNVQDRISGYFGPESRMQVSSAVGEGTEVAIVLNREAAERAKEEADKLQESALPSIAKPVVS